MTIWAQNVCRSRCRLPPIPARLASEAGQSDTVSLCTANSGSGIPQAERPRRGRVQVHSLNAGQLPADLAVVDCLSHERTSVSTNAAFARGAVCLTGATVSLQEFAALYAHDPGKRRLKTPKAMDDAFRAGTSAAERAAWAELQLWNRTEAIFLAKELSRCGNEEGGL